MLEGGSGVVAHDVYSIAQALPVRPALAFLCHVVA